MRRSEHKDFMGRLIFGGDYIVYPGMRIQSAEMFVGEVVETNFSKQEGPYWDEMLNRNVMGKRATLRVKGAWPGNPRWKANNKIVTLQYPYRVVVIDPHKVCDAAKEAIDRVGQGRE